MVQQTVLVRSNITTQSILATTPSQSPEPNPDRPSQPTNRTRAVSRGSNHDLVAGMGPLRIHRWTEESSTQPATITHEPSTQLQAPFYGETAAGLRRDETWRNVSSLGSGDWGSVMLQECLDPAPVQRAPRALRAVKAVLGTDWETVGNEIKANIKFPRVSVLRLFINKKSAGSWRQDPMLTLLKGSTFHVRAVLWVLRKRRRCVSLPRAHAVGDIRSFYASTHP